MKTITPAGLQSRLSTDQKLVLIDVRTPSEFGQVHVPEAQNLPLGENISEKLAHQKEQHIYILCHSGGRACKAAELLAREGFLHCVVVEGGTQAWVESGFPVVRPVGAKTIMSLERQVRIAAGALVLLGVLLGFAITAKFFLLSGLVGAGLIFAGITDYCGMGLLLARMPWNR